MEEEEVMPQTKSQRKNGKKKRMDIGLGWSRKKELLSHWADRIKLHISFSLWHSFIQSSIQVFTFECPDHLGGKFYLNLRMFRTCHI